MSWFAALAANKNISRGKYFNASQSLVLSVVLILSKSFSASSCHGEENC